VQIDRVIAKGQLIGITFMQDNLAASQTDVQLTISEVASAAGNAVEGITMPFAGEIVGISADLSAAASAGTLTVGPTVGGTEKSTLTQTVTTATSTRATVLRGSIPFAAGAIIGAEITTDASWNATTSDLAVTVWVLLNLEGI